MRARFPHIRVAAIASALPAREIAMETFELTWGAKEVRRVARGTGIHAVRAAGNLSSGDLCAAAAENLFKSCDVPPDSIDGVVVVTQTPDRLMPGTSALLQDRLGLNRRVAALDINSGCSGYIYGLYQAAMMVSAGCSRVLLLTGDVITKLLDEDDHHVRMVFGDAATATLVEHGAGTLSVEIETDGSGARHLGTPIAYGGDGGSLSAGYLHMDGAEVMGFVVGQVPPLVRRFLDYNGLNDTDVTLFAMHQANALIVEYLRKQMQVDSARMPIGVADVGNTGPSSIPLLLSMTQAGRQPASLARVLLCGFGVGLSLGAALADFRATKIVGPCDVDDDGPRPSELVAPPHSATIASLGDHQ